VDDASTTEPSLLMRLGGEAGHPARLINLQYEQILADDYLGEYFMGVDIDRLKTAQLAFCARRSVTPRQHIAAFPLQQAHNGQLVTELAFDQFVDLFIAARP